MKRPNFRERLLLLAPLVILLVPLLFNSLSTDAFDRKLRAMAGPDATNCGTLSKKDIQGDYYSIERKVEAMNSCADAAHDAGRPFYMRQWVHMDGIKTNLGLLRTPDGKLLRILYNVPRGVPFFLNWAADMDSFKPSEPIKPRKGSKRKVSKTRYWLLW